MRWYWFGSIVFFFWIVASSKRWWSRSLCFVTVESSDGAMVHHQKWLLLVQEMLTMMETITATKSIVKRIERRISDSKIIWCLMKICDTKLKKKKRTSSSLSLSPYLLFHFYLNCEQNRNVDTFRIEDWENTIHNPLRSVFV